MIISFANASDVLEFRKQFGTLPELNQVDIASHEAIAEYRRLTEKASGSRWNLYTISDTYNDNDGHKLVYIEALAPRPSDIEYWQIVTISGYGTERRRFNMPDYDEVVTSEALLTALTLIDYKQD